MKSVSSVRIRLLLLIAVLTYAPAAFAQSHVRVTRDQTVIWARNFLSVETLVRAGQVLEVVGRRGEWYEVVIPIENGRAATTGFIAAPNVEPVGGPPAPQAPLRPRGARPPSVPRGPSTGIRAYGHLGYGPFLASQSFEAVLGEAPAQLRGPWYGGGAQYQSRSGWFVQGGIERFRRTGERVFVFDDTVFRLGIPDTVTITPVTVTAGYRANTRSAAPYVGGGIGRAFLTETSPQADESENTKLHATSYHALGGIEWQTGRSVAFALEIQYTSVPDALSRGAAGAFNEHDLGGVQGRVKLLIGR